MIYSLVARENQVLVDYSEYQGNFSQVVLSEVALKFNPDFASR
jgi:hypothetical protein